MNKLITIISHYAPGALNFRGPLIKELVDSGARVVILAPDWTPALRHELKKLGAKAESFPLERTGINPFHDLATFWFIWRWLRRERPSIVFSYAAKTNVWGMVAAALACVPKRVAMVAGMGYAFTEGALGHRSLSQHLLAVVLVVLYKCSFWFAHKVVVQNPDDAKDLQRWCRLPSLKTVLVNGTGVPLDDWPFEPPHYIPITFTLAARMLREKGIFEFLNAAEIIKLRYPQTRFLLLGGLDVNPGAIRAADLEVWVTRGIVQWPGQVEVKSWLKQTSVFVLPSYREGVPRSVQEAMAMGRPIITTDVPGCRETVEDGLNGFMVPPRDVSSLVSAMEKFVLDQQLIHKMGLESRRLVEEKFDVRETNRRLMAAFGIGKSDEKVV